MKFSKPNFFKSPLEHYKDTLSNVMGKQPEILREKSVKAKLPFVYNLVFKDEQSSILSAFTYGLSSIDGDQKGLKKEICIQMKAENLQWALVAAYLVNQLRGDCPFNEGEIIKFGQQIEEDSKLNAFVVVHCIIPQVQQQLSNSKKSKNIQLMQLIPIFEQEIPVIAKLGLAEFIDKIQSEIFNPKRKLINI